MTVKALVLRAPGANCNRETSWALEAAGADPVEVHINSFLRGDRRLRDFGLMVIPGGFSFGDDIASGKVLANRLLYRLRESLEEFLRLKRPLMGICNGFQVLVKCGLLPGFSGWDEPPAATLADNDSGKFECRWVHLRTSSRKSFFTRDLPEVFPLPVAHGEGKFVAASRAALDRLEKNGQVLFRYVDPRGRRPVYPDNPNGSTADIAGIVNAEGHVMGLMPHPERYAFPRQHPFWTRLKPLPRQGIGLTLFKNAVRCAG
jgi:phosphoribosylformylglycinamidine synthase